MPIILAHRGNTEGPVVADENGLRAIRRSLASGFGLEIDIRRASDGRFYLAHDIQSPANVIEADEAFDEIRRHPHTRVALNIKELGDEDALVSYLERLGVLDLVVLFDMELIEAVPGDTARSYRRLHASLPLAARVSDRGEPIARALDIDVAHTIWLDEFDGPWATADDVAHLHAAGRRVWAVSPDLHGRPLDVARQRWIDFLAWGVDAICTDYPHALAAVVAHHAVQVAV